jgi:preprotein translocase subunit YajC
MNRNLPFDAHSLSFSGFSQDIAMNLNELFIQLPLAQAQSPGGGFAQFLPLILLFVGMWFLIIAPQRKRQKAHEQMLSELKTGDEIVTSGGIYGTITNVKDDRLVVRIADNTKIELGKSFVANKVGDNPAK